MTLAIAVALVLLTTAPAAATPSQKLAEARELFQRGDYPGTIAILADLLYPTRSLASAAELTEAHVMLGVSYFEIGNSERAALEFEAALFIDPTLELDPNVQRPEVVGFFNERKKAISDRLAEQTRKDQENARYRKFIESTKQVEIEHHAYYVNFMPFGAGQFQNGEPGKGKLFAIAQAALGGTSMIFFGIQWFRYGIPLDIPPDEVDLAKRLQYIQLGTGWAFAVVYAWGVVDALRNYKATVVRTTKFDPKYLPEDFELPDDSSGSSFHVSPLLLPAAGDRVGFGVLLRWEL